MSRVRSIKPEFWTDSASERTPIHYWIYCVCEEGAQLIGPCKIGVAAYPEKRFSSLQCGNWRQLIAVWQMRLERRDTALKAEERCLHALRPDIYTVDNRPRLKSEWVDASPSQVLEVVLKFLNSYLDEEMRRVA